MARAREKISDVFKTVGQPIVTYVKRDEGKLERRLNDDLNERGQLCLVTGPSKTGKTTLYREVLSRRSEVPLIVQCDCTKRCDAIWKQALEAVDFERVESTTTASTVKLAGEKEAAAKVGWTWFAEATTRLKGVFGRDMAETEARKCVLSDPAPDLLIRLLKKHELRSCNRRFLLLRRERENCTIPTVEEVYR